MDRSELTRRRSAERGYILIGTAVVVTLCVAVFAMVMLRGSLGMQARVRESAARAEVLHGTNQLAQDSAAKVGDAFAANAADLNHAIDAMPGPVGLPSVDRSLAGAGATGLGRAAVTFANWGPATYRDGSRGGDWSLVDVPDGQYRLFGNRSQFVGRLRRFDYTPTNTVADGMLRKSVGDLAPAGRRVDIYEFPANTFAVHGNLEISANVDGSALVLEAMELSGALSGSATLMPGARASVNPGAQIGEVSFDGAIDQRAGAEFAKMIEAGELVAGGVPVTPESISIVRGDAYSAVAVFADMTPDAEGVPQMFRDSDAFTAWQGYTLPAYQTRVRVRAELRPDYSGADVQLALADPSDPALAAGETEVTSFLAPVGVGFVNGFRVVDVGGGIYLLAFDPVRLRASGLPGLDDVSSVYVEFRNPAGERSGSHGVLVQTATETLGPEIAAFSLVTPNRLHFAGRFNSENKPASFFAPSIRFGSTVAPSEAEVVGQRGILGQTGYDPVDALRGPDGSQLPTDSASVALTDITSPDAVPPVVLKGWLVLTREN